MDTEIKVPSVENSDLTNVLPLKPAVGQTIAMHALPTARILFIVITFQVPSPSFFSKSLHYFLTALVVANTVSIVSL